jgi:hypothetical protein
LEAQFDSATDRLWIDTDRDGTATFQLVRHGMAHATHVDPSDLLCS